MEETQQTGAGLLIKVAPPLWSNEFLELLSAWAMKVHDHAPTFGAWLDDIAAKEQLRRLKQNTSDPTDVTPVTVPVTAWSNKELADALIAVHCLSYSVGDYAVGAFVDNVTMAINVVAAQRLRKGT